VKFQFCQEDISVDHALEQMVGYGMAGTLVNEVGKTLLYQRSLQDYRVEKPGKNRVKEMLKGFCDQYGLKNEQQLQSWLSENHQSKQTVINRMVFHEQLGILKQLVIPDALLQETFLKRKHQYDWVLFGLIQVQKEALSWELYYRIHDDHQDFETLAKQYSMTPEAVHGGIIGPAHLDQINPGIKKHLLALQSGDITLPFTLDGQTYLIARLLRMDQAVLDTRLAGVLREELFNEWTQRQLSLGQLQLDISSFLSRGALA
jgi:hypothetical protein